MKLLLLLYLSCYSPSLSYSQTSFSPFSFLGSLFKSAPSWTSPRQVKQRTPIKQSKKYFRPHLPLGPSFSASQEIPQVVRFQNKLPSSEFTARPITKLKYPVIRITTITTPTPKIFIKSFPTSTEKNTFAPSANEFQVTENEPHSQTTIVQSSEIINTIKGNTEVLYPVTIIKQSDQTNQTTNFVTPQSSFSSYSPSHESGVSGPNPGDFPIISLIDEPAVKYYDQVFQNIGPTKDSSNPYYAPEEFNYNQDPILIDHRDPNEDVFKEITQSVYDEVETVDDATQLTNIKDSLRAQLSKKDEHSNQKDVSEEETTSTHFTTTLSTIFLELNDSKEYKENSPRSIDFKRVASPQQLFKKSVKSKEFTNLVNTIEYKPADIKPRNKQKDISTVNDNLTESLASLVDCGAGSEIGFCSMASSYPKERVEALVENCSDIIEAFKAVVPEDFDALGDNSISVISSEKDLARPWSWKVYAYKKRQICDSELSFTRPSYALDTEGNWSIILQTDRILQRVSMDTCTKHGYPCPGVGGCGKKSSCVQRFNHQLLLSLPSSTSSSHSSCPSIRAFKFPSGCVCHAETKSDQDLVSDSDSDTVL